jgi:hypothetical protein
MFTLFYTVRVDQSDSSVKQATLNLAGVYAAGSLIPFDNGGGQISTYPDPLSDK